MAQHAIDTVEAARDLSAQLGCVGLSALVCDAEGQVLALTPNPGELLSPRAATALHFPRLGAEPDAIESLQELWDAKGGSAGGWHCRRSLERRSGGVDVDVAVGAARAWLAILQVPAGQSISRRDPPQSR